MSDGGGAATRGFVIQAMVALLDSLGRDDWSTVTVEPDLSSEKVDIQWKRGGQTERHSQVKNRSGGIEVSDVRKWAKALQARSSTADCVLHVVGPATRGVVALGREVDGVTIETCGHDLYDIRARCRVALHRLLDDRGLYGRSDAVLARGVDRLAGILVVKSADKFEWSPESLLAEVQAAVAADVVEDVVPVGVRWSQTRIIEIEANGDCVETHITTYVNDGDREVTGLGALVRVTDSDTTFEAAWDPDGEPVWKAGEIGASYAVWVRPRGILRPRAARHVGVRVRRAECADVRHPMLNYADTALPPESPSPGCAVSTWVLLPGRWYGSSIEAPRAELASVGLAGFRSTAGRRFKFRVRAVAPTSPTGTCATSELLRHLTQPVRDASVIGRIRDDPGLAQLLGDVVL